jgi:hypothetical protein
LLGFAHEDWRLDDLSNLHRPSIKPVIRHA